MAQLQISIDDGTTVDCAYAQLADSIQYTKEVIAIGSIVGSRAPARGEEVRKSGRTTGLTTGTVEDVNATIQIGSSTFQKQILIQTTARFAAGGDSGSLIVGSDMKGVGLLMAGRGDGTSTFANRLQLVEGALGVTVIT